MEKLLSALREEIKNDPSNDAIGKATALAVLTVVEHLLSTLDSIDVSMREIAITMKHPR